MNTKFGKIGVHVPSILLPGGKTDLTNWSVVACDQYTSQPEYWEEVGRKVNDKPSTLQLIYPEVYLEEENRDERINSINGIMKKYLDDKILVEQKPGFIYVDRKTSRTESRKGLILAVDLEKYNYSKGSQALIRATEGTVIERLPPRIKIRENASIELPHIMVLIDDPDKTVIEPVAEQADKLPKIYDFELMMDGGHIKGYRIESPELMENICKALEKLADPDIFRKKYGIGSSKDVLLFAVGDGNHSLASAKAFWDNLKNTLPEKELESHPARYALVEVVNVHDTGLCFEPIHRVVFNVDPVKLLDSMVEYYNRNGSEACCKLFESREAANSELKDKNKSSCSHIVTFVMEGGAGLFEVKNPKYNLEVGTLQSFLDEYVKNNNEVKIDYIHGEEVVANLGSKEGNIGFYLPVMDKCDLFKTVIIDGVLPRKTFSMGEAEEKRFYLECRRISKE